MTKSALTIDFIRAALDYDPATGLLTWKSPQSNRVRAGNRAGVIAANGRRYISVGGEKHMAHRLAWAHHYGEWPAGDVKQKNGDYDDCRIDNLVEQSRAETASNRRVNANSKSGHPGVTWCQRNQCWQVHITKDYKQIGIGYFSDLAAAIEARREAEASALPNVTAEDRQKAAHSIARRRRQRVAWKKANAHGATGWASFDAFCEDMGDIPETRLSLLSIDYLRPIGPGNFRWSLPLEAKFDFQTRDGRIAYNRAHRAANPSLYRAKELRKNFDMEPEDYDRLLGEQLGVCAICERPESVERGGKSEWLSVDHCHTTGKVRGLLCTQCNHAIGKLDDDPELMRRAIAYIEKHGDGKRAWPTPTLTEITHTALGQKLLQEAAGHG